MSTTNSIPAAQPALREQLREFILENLAHPKGVTSFTDDEPLMETGVIDSLGIFRLVSFLEDELGVRISDEEINPDTLKNLNTIEALVIRKREK
ncbi:MAG TPA: acyl carrier protein [Candidatus Aquilonibacter sp.]|nr:acyl carrier protein [Candidatus Aquilonibacter sp.]